MKVVRELGDPRLAEINTIFGTAIAELRKENARRIAMAYPGEIRLRNRTMR